MNLEVVFGTDDGLEDVLFEEGVAGENREIAEEVLEAVDFDDSDRLQVGPIVEEDVDVQSVKPLLDPEIESESFEEVGDGQVETGNLVDHVLLLLEVRFLDGFDELAVENVEVVPQINDGTVEFTSTGR